MKFGITTLQKLGKLSTIAVMSVNNEEEKKKLIKVFCDVRFTNILKEYLTNFNCASDFRIERETPFNMCLTNTNSQGDSFKILINTDTLPTKREITVKITEKEIIIEGDDHYISKGNTKIHIATLFYRTFIYDVFSAAAEKEVKMPVTCNVCGISTTTKGKKSKLEKCMICMRGVHHDCVISGFSCKGGCDMKEQEFNYGKPSWNVVEGDTILQQYKDLKRNLPKYEVTMNEEKRVKLSEAKEKEKGEDNCVKMTYNQEYKGNENFKDKKD